jgi:hypothetical protein
MRNIIQSLAVLLNPQCKDTSFLQTSNNIYSISPIAIVVKPWLGRHHVYGIFVLPSEHQIKYPILLTVKGAGIYRKESHMVKVNIDSSDPRKYDHYHLRVHLKTRVALVMMLKGLSFQIRNPINWTLSYSILNDENTQI